MTELQKTKVALETKHKEMVTQYQKDIKNNMASISERLYEAQSRNNNVDKSIEIIMQRIEKLESEENYKWQNVVLVIY